MTKLSYYLCVAQNGDEEILYGTSKKEVIEIGEKLGVGPFTSVTEQVLNDLKQKYDEKALTEFRQRSKSEWTRKPATKSSKEAEA